MPNIKRGMMGAAGAGGLSGYTFWSWGPGQGNAQPAGLYCSSPTQVGSTNADYFTSIVSWGSAGAGIKSDYTLWVWGYNNAGRLGLGNTSNVTNPTQVGTLEDWKLFAHHGYVGAGTKVTKTDGTLWTWGDGGNGANGHGNIISLSSPVQLGALTNWAGGDGGSYTQSAVKTDGTLWVWGHNSHGELGLGDINNRSSPVQVGSLTNWSGGYKKLGTCANFAAIKTDGTLWTWGDNGQGQLGQGDTDDRSSPVQVGSLTNWSKVDVAGQGDMVIATKTDGTLWTWGDGGSAPPHQTGGQLGLGDTGIDRSSPCQVGSLTNWSVPIAGTNTVGGLKTDGTLWVWGGNKYGTLGQGTAADDTNVSSPIQVGSSTDWVKASGQHFRWLTLRTP